MRHPLALVVLPLALAACADHPQPSDAHTLDDAFRAAARETGVPRDLLAAIAWTESRLDHRQGAPNDFGRVGLMGLGTDEAVSPHAPSLSWAASDIGLQPDDLRADPREEIRGAAHLLADYANEDLGDEPDHLDDWWPVVARYSGESDAFLADAYAEDVFRTLEHGYIHRTSSGERLELLPHDLPSLQEPADERMASDYYGAAAFVPAASCNYTDSSRTSVSEVVIHTVEGSYAGAISWFGNCGAKASAHYVVRSSDGQVTQVVDESDVAWHAGNSSVNKASIGVEHEGYTTNGAYYTDAMYRGSAKLVADICDRYGIPKDRSHIIGHAEVPDPDGSGWGGASHHTDPGPYWDWDYYMSLVRGEAPPEVTSPTADLTGYVREGDVYSGAGLPGATVTLDDGRSTLTDASGAYVFHGLDARAYTVSAHLDGYQDASASKDLQADTLNWRSFALVPDGSGAPADSGSAAPADSGLPGAPVGLEPDGTTVTDDAVHLTWSDTGAPADLHEVELWWWDGDQWQYYWTYNPATDEKWFWPSVHGTSFSYAVRAHNGNGWGDWSGWAEFEVE